MVLFSFENKSADICDSAHNIVNYLHNYYYYNFLCYFRLKTTLTSSPQAHKAQSCAHH